MNENEFYSTSDFVTLTVLFLLKHSVSSIDKSNPKRIIFSFENTPRLESDLQALQLGKLKVDPNDFWNTQKRIKSLLYAD